MTLAKPTVSSRRQRARPIPMQGSPYCGCIHLRYNPRRHASFKKDRSNLKTRPKPQHRPTVGIKCALFVPLSLQ